jgi:hypothetical protein
MIDYFLKFTDEAQANSILYTKVPTVFNEEGEATEWMDKANYDNIDIIGTIYEPFVEDEEPVALDGYHVNIRHSAEALELDAYAVTPTNPRRIWG